MARFNMMRRRRRIVYEESYIEVSATTRFQGDERCWRKGRVKEFTKDYFHIT